MAYVTKVSSNGGDTLFKVDGVGFGSTQGTFSGAVYNTNTGGGLSTASISTWSDVQITGTLSADYKNPGKLYVKTSFPDNNNAYHPTMTSGRDYTIS